VGWLARRRERRILAAAASEITQFLLQLKGFDIHELALVAAQAADVALQFSRRIGVNLMQPQLTMMTIPIMLPQLTEAAQELLRRGEPFRAPGFMVWVYTLHAEERPELRHLAKEMWDLLARGFPDAELAAFEFQTTTGYEIIVEDDFLRIPRGYRLDGRTDPVDV